MSVRIIVDSAANVSQAIQYRLVTIPMTVSFGEENYIDGVTIDHKTFYKKLSQSDVLPTTSLITPSQYEVLFQKIVDEGDTAVVLTLSSEFSGTYQSAMIAAEIFPGKIYVVDTLAASLSIGIMAEYAIGLADKGMDAQSIAKEIERQRHRVCLVAVLDTLEYLKKGGRISKTVAFAGTILNIKPVISVENSQIKILDKARGIKMGNRLLSQNIFRMGSVDTTMPVLFGYTGLSDELLQGFLQESEAMWENIPKPLPVAGVGSIIGTHAGPGAYAVAFFKKNTTKR